LQHSPQSRPLDALAITVTIALCLTWGFNQVAIKLAIHDIPPLIQSAARSAIAALCVAAYAQVRGIALFKRDGTLWAGIAAGVLFAVEFVLVYRGLVWTTATRGVLFLYAPRSLSWSARACSYRAIVFIRCSGLAWRCLSWALSSPSACRHRQPIRISCPATLCCWAAALRGPQPRW